MTKVSFDGISTPMLALLQKSTDAIRKFAADTDSLKAFLSRQMTQQLMAKRLNII